MTPLTFPCLEYPMTRITGCCLIALTLLATGAGAPVLAAELRINLDTVPPSADRRVPCRHALTCNPSGCRSMRRPSIRCHTGRYRWPACSAAPPRQTLQFIGSDGFAAEIPAGLILNRRGSNAWLAVEEPAGRWPEPPLASMATRAPFTSCGPAPRLPGSARNSGAAWSRSASWTASRRASGDPADPAVPAGGPVRRGLTVLQRTGFACPTLNGAGDAKFGPNLNIPHNPTEYLRAELLRTYVGDPQSRRRWSQAKTPGFSPQTLSDADLDALLAYCWYMTVRKIESATLD